jgi:phosphoadenosine phosphosulfate reductase
MSYNKVRELERYPKIKRAYLSAFSRMLDERKRRELKTEWQTAEEVMEWWLSR